MAGVVIPVGRDCACGFPLLWRNGREWCAVYGSHPAPRPLAEFAGLVAELDALPCACQRCERKRALERDRQRARRLRRVA